MNMQFRLGLIIQVCSWVQPKILKPDEIPASLKFGLHFSSPFHNPKHKKGLEIRTWHGAHYQIFLFPIYFLFLPGLEVGNSSFG